MSLRIASFLRRGRDSRHWACPMLCVFLISVVSFVNLIAFFVFPQTSSSSSAAKVVPSLLAALLARDCIRTPAAKVVPSLLAAILPRACIRTPAAKVVPSLLAALLARACIRTPAAKVVPSLLAAILERLHPDTGGKDGPQLVSTRAADFDSKLAEKDWSPINTCFPGGAGFKRTCMSLFALSGYPARCYLFWFVLSRGNCAVDQLWIFVRG